MPRLLDDVARDLRAAVLGSEYEQAVGLAEEYAQAAQREWERMSPAARALSGLPKQSQELLTWARAVTIMHQGMAAQHLASIESAHRNLTARANYLQSSAL